MQSDPSLAIQVEQLSFRYSNVAAPDGPYVLKDVDLNLPKGSRCILVGANGAGELYKSCYLQIVHRTFTGSFSDVESRVTALELVQL